MISIFFHFIWPTVISIFQTAILPRMLIVLKYGRALNILKQRYTDIKFVVFILQWRLHCNTFDTWYPLKLKWFSISALHQHYTCWSLNDQEMPPSMHCWWRGQDSKAMRLCHCNVADGIVYLQCWWGYGSLHNDGHQMKSPRDKISHQ